MMAALRPSELSGDLRRQEPMSRHTSWRAGGPAELFYVPAGLDDLCLFLRQLDPDVPVFWFGLGSNLLVRDGGLRGAVIAGRGVFTVLERMGDLGVRAGTSVPCTRLARQCVRWALGPSEFFAGIPGTVGGALAMNAGAHGGETWDRVRSVRVVTRGGEIVDRAPDEYEVGYRSVRGPENEWFVEAELLFERGSEPSMDVLKELQARRRDTQPLGLPSCGSVFRNPPGDHAARLIESAGLKARRIGDAEVSAKHANFIINRGKAKAADIESLVDLVQETVFDVHGVRLQHEVRIVGEAAA